MEDEITEIHWIDADGNLAGGQSFGVGFAIAWQNGLLVNSDGKKAPNGASAEDVIRAVIGHIEACQRGKTACARNVMALQHLSTALNDLRMREVNL